MKNWNIVISSLLEMNIKISKGDKSYSRYYLNKAFLGFCFYQRAQITPQVESGAEGSFISAKPNELVHRSQLLK